MKTKWILLFTFVVSTYCINAQSWLWAQSGGESVGSDFAMGNITDNSGNTYVTGYYFQTATFGTYTLTSLGAQDVFILKYDNNGIIQWAKSIGGISTDYGSKISLDNAGNIYVTGQFSDVVNFGTTTLTSFGWGDVFIAKYDPNGIESWVQQAGGIDNSETGNDVAVDNNGNVYIAGGYTSTSVNFSGTTLTNSGSALYTNDLFIAKYDALGNLSWAISPVGTGSEGVTKLAIDSNGDLLAFGSFSTDITLGATTYTSAGSTDLVLMKYNAVGTVSWAKQMGGANMDLGYGIALDSQDNILLTGGFSGTATFGGNTLTTAGIYNELYLLKLDPSGNDIWHKQQAATSNNVGISVKVNSNNDVYLASDFNGTAQVGSSSYISSGSGDLYIVKYNSSGTKLWSIQGGGNNFDDMRDMSLDPSGNVYISGRYRNTATYGVSTITSTGSDDVFLAKLQDPTASINEFTTSNFSIYPNPSDKEIIFSDYLDSYSVVNNIGLTICEINSSANSFNTAQLSPGFYYLKTDSGVYKFSVDH